jgi:hypothetical protein
MAKQPRALDGFEMPFDGWNADTDLGMGFNMDIDEIGGMEMGMGGEFSYFPVRYSPH